MNYRHSVIKESYELHILAVVASQCAAERLRLSYRPWVNFFIEDNENGRYERPFRVSGFVDYFSDAENLDIFVRHGRSIPQTVQTIFHEGFHIAEFIRKDKTPLALSELHAERFSRTAPWGTYNDVMTALNDEIEVYVSARGDEQEMAGIRERRLHNSAEQRQFIEMLQRQSRYSSALDDDDGDDESEEIAFPVKQIKALDPLTLVKAARYLKDVYERDQCRAQGIKERKKWETRRRADWVRYDASVEAEFNRWNNAIGEKA